MTDLSCYVGLVTRVCLVTSLLLVMMITSLPRPTDGVDPSKVDGKSLFQSLMGNRCSVSCVTTRVRPVCGTNDVTYASRCALKRAKKCDRLKIRVKHRGKCPGDVAPLSKCMSERRSATQGVRRPGEHVPSCKADGSYTEVQCHATAGFCWCVARDGRHIPRTSVKGGRPRCKGKRRGRNDKGKRKRRCNSKDRQNFNSDLIKVFKEEYLRVHPNPPAEGEANSEEFGSEKAIVLWKFDELDVNQDGKLRFKEIRNFGRMVKKLIKPRSCAKRFVRNCDKKKDRTIEKTEWTLCLGVDIKPGQDSSKPNASGAIPLGPLVRLAEVGHLPRPSNPLSPPQGLPGLTSGPMDGQARPGNSDRKEVPMSCLEEKEAAMKYHSQEPDAKHFIPACTPDGLWEKAQCHKSRGYCWCVKEQTGFPIPGTATYRVMPDCSFKNERPMKGCPFDQKRRFVVDLMGDLIEERKNDLYRNSNQTSYGSGDTISSREAVAHWKLKSLDTNNNGMLERKEWRPMRKTTLKNRRYPRKCRRNFIRYCDEDNNKRITYEEWKACLGLTGNNFSTLPLNPKRQGSNPFVDQLT